MKFTSREFSLKRMPSEKPMGVFGIKISTVTKWVNKWRVTICPPALWNVQVITICVLLWHFRARTVAHSNYSVIRIITSVLFPVPGYSVLSQTVADCHVLENRPVNGWSQLDRWRSILYIQLYKCYFRPSFLIPFLFSSRRERSKVPYIVRQCLEEIERRGMEEVGIYRVSGVATDIQALKTAFDTSKYLCHPYTWWLLLFWGFYFCIFVNLTCFIFKWSFIKGQKPSKPTWPFIKTSWRRHQEVNDLKSLTRLTGESIYVLANNWVSYFALLIRR